MFNVWILDFLVQMSLCSDVFFILISCYFDFLFVLISCVLNLVGFIFCFDFIFSVLISSLF